MRRFKACLHDCILGPKPREDNTQTEGEDGGESSPIEKYSLEMIEEEDEEEEDERKILLWLEEEEGLLHPPTPPPPLRSAIASCLGEKRTSTHNVTFSCPTLPYVTSL